ncbi:MAG: Gfo/Idh/MocA family oxidoreductase [Planctomycetales bacterium]|nr:Gfo/Idh/MocA family oxidoreductase [Planctomycetales bacterium]
MTTKRIGYFDYRLDNFHAEVYLKALRGPLASRGFEIAAATALDHEPSRDWATERSVPYFATLADMADRVDFLMVLAPANPELHLEMCRSAFALGKPTFVDKTFAPSEAVAREIFALADAQGVAVQSTSALRTTRVQQYAADLADTLRNLVIYASGSSEAEYAIHPVELAVSCLGPEIKRLVRLGPDNHPQFLMVFSDKRTALIDLNLVSEAPFAAVATTDHGNEFLPIDGARLFIDAAASILDFFESRQPTIDRRETLAVRRVLDAIAGAPWGEFVEFSDAVDASHVV